jgi:hypothetical protein
MYTGRKSKGDCIMNNTNFIVGQEVVLKIITGSNAYRRLPKETNGKPDILKRLIFTTVKSVGKKYITVDYSNIKFDRTDEYRQVTNFSKDYELFGSAKDAINADTLEMLWSKLRTSICYSSKCPYTLEQIEKVMDILGIK